MTLRWRVAGGIVSLSPCLGAPAVALRSAWSAVEDC